MSDRFFDVAIIGGSVAAAAAALTLAATSRSVVLIAPALDETDRIGEFLSPAANALLSELGLAEAFASGPHRPAHATYAAWGSVLLAQRNSIGLPDGPGHILDRAAFLRMLRQAAARSGATEIRGNLADVSYDADLWSLRLRGGEALAARFVLDCSGRAAVVGRRFATRYRSDRLIAVSAFLHQQDNDVEPTPATIIEAVPQGWWYASLLPDRRLAIALFGDPDTLPRSLSRDSAAFSCAIAETQNLKRWIESAGFAISARSRVASAGTTWLEPVADKVWAAAGDAATAFDPLSSHGLTTALWSGRQAALAAAAALAGNDTLLAHYAAAVRASISRFLVEQRAVYALERRWPSLPFWSRRNSLERNVSQTFLDSYSEPGPRDCRH
ncbi:MAG: glycine oxidase maturase GoxB [Edaphobacter sp.]